MKIQIVDENNDLLDGFDDEGMNPEQEELEALRIEEKFGEKELISITLKFKEGVSFKQFHDEEPEFVITKLKMT